MKLDTRAVIESCEELAARMAHGRSAHHRRRIADKGKKPGKGAESIIKVDTLPKTRFRTERRRL